MVAAEPAIAHAPLFYKPLEKIKETHLRKTKGNFDHFLPIPQSVTLNWWLQNIPTSYKSTRGKSTYHPLYWCFLIWLGVGAFYKTDGTRTAGNWSSEEQNSHINILELKACQLALHSLCKEKTHFHFRLLWTTQPVSPTLINMGGDSST